MNTNKLKVVFVTMDEPYYVPTYINNTFLKLPATVDIMKVYALPPNLSNMHFLKTVKDYLSYFGFNIFLYMVFLRFVYCISDIVNQYFLKTNQFHSVELVCKTFNCAFSRIKKINSKEVLSELRELKPDIIFSLAAPQIFRRELISIPSKGCLNIHSSLLPMYRGLNANFWVLAKGEKITGVTIHYINPGIDDGDILLQEKIYIEDDWSLHDLYLKAIDLGSDMIARCIQLIYGGQVLTQKNDISRGSYYSFPTRENVKEFRSRNRRFFKYY